jgi:hypothetical protein
MKLILRKKFLLGPYEVYDPKVVTSDEAVTKDKQFFLLFSILWKGMYVTNLKGTFIANEKKVKNQPTLVILSSLHFATTSTYCTVLPTRKVGKWV